MKKGLFGYLRFEDATFFFSFQIQTKNANYSKGNHPDKSNIKANRHKTTVFINVEYWRKSKNDIRPEMRQHRNKNVFVRLDKKPANNN